MKIYKNYINGEWIASSSGQLMDVQNPANEEIIAAVQLSNTDDAALALETSQKAQKSWAKLSPVKRANYIYKIIDKLMERQTEFAEILVREQGKTLNEAMGEVIDTCDYFKYAADSAVHIRGDIFPSNESGEQIWIQRIPYGVTVALCAWNYPLALIGRKLGPALVTGNTMVIKPHELTPLASAEFMTIIDEVGLPKGVVNFITGSGAEIGNALVSSPITRLVSVTGSVNAGRAIYTSAAQNITTCCLELGGKSTFIIMDDADVDTAAEEAVKSRFANCGQVCICNEHVLVHRKVADQVISKILEKTKQITIGDPMTNPDMGPKVSESELDKMDRIISKSVEQGAKVLYGGERLKGKGFENGFWYMPTLITDVTHDMCVAREEVFGPVLAITVVDSFEEAIAFADDAPYGLSTYVFTKDYTKLMYAIENHDVGTIFFNKGITGMVQGYHNGHKHSGIGGEDGVYGIEGFLQKLTVYLKY